MDSRSDSDVTVRRLLEEEWRALRTLRLRALKSDPLAFGSTLATEEAYPDELWQSRALRGAEAPDQATYVAVAPARELVGMAVLTLADSGGNLYGMWVEPAWRGHGLGGKLLDAALGWAARSPASLSVRLEVNPRQAAAVQLYRSRAFEFSDRSRPLEHTAGELVREMVRAPSVPFRGEPERTPAPGRPPPPAE